MHVFIIREYNIEIFGQKYLESVCLNSTKLLFKSDLNNFQRESDWNNRIVYG